MVESLVSEQTLNRAYCIVSYHRHQPLSFYHALSCTESSHFAVHVKLPERAQLTWNRRAHACGTFDSRRGTRGIIVNNSTATCDERTAAARCRWQRTTKSKSNVINWTQLSSTGSDAGTGIVDRISKLSRGGKPAALFFFQRETAVYFVTYGWTLHRSFGPPAYFNWSNRLAEDVTRYRNHKPQRLFPLRGSVTLLYTSIIYPRCRYRRHRGDMIEVYKILHNIYDIEITQGLLQLANNTRTRGHSLKLVTQPVNHHELK